jgi:threonine dehydratase
MIGRDEIEAAAARIAPHVRRTPAIALPPGSLGVAAPLAIKLESLQHAGSFKSRGAFNRLLAAPPPAAGVAAASGGNHGIAVAHAAASLGVAVEIFVHAGTAPAKRAFLDATGAAVHVVGDSYAEAEAACRAHVARSGAEWIPAYDHPDVVAGQGTLAREFVAQAELDTLLVAIGGGGLAGGCAAWLQREVRVVGVETRGCATMHRALAAGEPVDVAISGAAADALGARRAGALPFALAARWMDGVVLVDDDDLRAAQRRLWRELRVAAELAGAAGLAALAAGAYRPAPDERVGIIVCGGNVDLRAVPT